MLQLVEAQWEWIPGSIVRRRTSPKAVSKQNPVPARAVLEPVLRILETGAQWHVLPQCYPNHKTGHRRFEQWSREKVLRAILEELANALREHGDFGERASFIDAPFTRALGRGKEIGCA